MHYLLILFLALALTIAWQTSVVADNPSLTELRCAETPAGRDDPSAATSDRRDCH